MKKVFKNRKGFTLVEMVLVIAIIVIFASVALIGAGNYVKLSKDAKCMANSHNVATESISNDICAQAKGT